MNPQTLKILLDIGSAVVTHIWKTVQDGDDQELKRLAQVWPEPIKSRLALMAGEARAIRKMREG